LRFRQPKWYDDYGTYKKTVGDRRWYVKHIAE
jgi:hypothetical protein